MTHFKQTEEVLEEILFDRLNAHQKVRYYNLLSMQERRLVISAFIKDKGLSECMVDLATHDLAEQLGNLLEAAKINIVFVKLFYDSLIEALENHHAATLQKVFENIQKKLDCKLGKVKSGANQVPLFSASFINK